MKVCAGPGCTRYARSRRAKYCSAGCKGRAARWAKRHTLTPETTLPGLTRPVRPPAPSIIDGARTSVWLRLNRPGEVVLTNTIRDSDGIVHVRSATVSAAEAAA